MDLKEVNRMRVKQLLLINVLFIVNAILLLVLINVATLTAFQFFIILGLIIATKGTVGLLKGDSTKSFIPIFEQVNAHEKAKMGKEWHKERKTNHIWNLVLGGFLFMQAYLNSSLSEQVTILDSYFLVVLLFTLVLVNITTIIRFRKIDRSINETEMKGYSRKSSLQGAGLGIIFAFIFVFITVFFIL